MEKHVVYAIVSSSTNIEIALLLIGIPEKNRCVYSGIPISTSSSSGVWLCTLQQVISRHKNNSEIVRILAMEYYY